MDDAMRANRHGFSEIDLADILKHQVVDRPLIYETGALQDGALEAVTRIAAQATAEAMKPAKIFQVVISTDLSTTLNPVATFIDQPDACMELLMRGAKVRYLGVEIYEKAKRKGLEAIMRNPVSVKTLVDAWYAEPLLAELAAAVDRAFLLK